MKVIHIAGHGIQHRVFVDIVKPPDIAEEVVPVQKAGQFIPFRVANQLAVFGQFNAFGDAGFDDLDIRKRFRDKIHGSASQTIQFGILVNGQKDHRDRHQVFVKLHLGDDLAAVLLRHLQIQQDEIDFVLMPSQHIQRLDPVGGIEDIVVILQQIAHDLTVYFCIVGNQDLFSAVDHGDGLIGRTALGAGLCRQYVLLQMLLSLVHGLVRLFKNSGKGSMPTRVIFRHAGRNGFPDFESGKIPGYGVDLVHQFVARIIVFAGQNDGKLVAADSKHRAVAENPADFRTGVPDAGVALLMAVLIVDRLHVVDITDGDGKGLLFAVFDRLVDPLFPLRVGTLVFDACQGIDIRHLSGCRQIRFRMRGKLLECPGEHADLVVPVVFQGRFIVAVLYLFRGHGQIMQRLGNALRVVQDHRGANRQNHKRGEEDIFDHPFPPAVDLGNRRRHIQPHAVSERRPDRLFFDAVEDILHMVIPDKARGIADGDLFAVKMFRVYLRMADKVAVLIEEKSISRLIDADIVYFPCEGLIIDLNADHADKPVLPIDRHIVRNDPGPQILGIIRRKPDALSRCLRDGKPDKL